jgi:hypothetical protein
MTEDEAEAHKAEWEQEMLSASSVSGGAQLIYPK